MYFFHIGHIVTKVRNTKGPRLARRGEGHESQSLFKVMQTKDLLDKIVLNQVTVLLVLNSQHSLNLQKYQFFSFFALKGRFYPNSG